ncbi:response regulator transcription factor [Cohnella cholangitidis]|uniref:Response regulator n=1 Tax=Cohnella cholangitidis TaxID=2598458 RepID=A0A7G5C453_9BACL|nr:response regulator [Cohnella cholangitidis]QMV43987.1 response regulator [Cohnella cholangitidis]
MYTVILVDDEKGIIEGLKVIMRRFLPECQVIGCAYDAVEGFRLAYELRPDIVITDIRMLQSTGLEMIEMLANEGIHTNVILLSGYSEFEYARKAMHLGVKYYLTKPVEEEELQSCVRKIIKDIEFARSQSRDLRSMSSLKTAHFEGTTDTPKTRNLIAEIKQYVNDHYNQNISLAELSNHFFLNLHYLSQMFKEKTGQTYLEYLTSVRIEHSKEMLEHSQMKIYEIGQRVGYSDTTHFSKVFEKIVGCKPSEYRKLPR